jgi:hypothetical protein
MSDDRQQAVVYCVKYALSTGIFQLKGRIDKEGYFCEDLPYRGKGVFPFVLSRKDYSVTNEGAQELFLELRDRKIASLRKQLAKLENMAPKFLDDTITETTND